MQFILHNATQTVAAFAHVYNLIIKIIPLMAIGYIRYNPSYSYYNRSTTYLDNVIK